MTAETGTYLVVVEKLREMVMIESEQARYGKLILDDGGCDSKPAMADD